MAAPRGSGGWQPASCTGSDGTTTSQTITAASVAFGQDSETENAIQFRVSDLAGLTGISEVYYVAIDANPPANPTDLSSSSHVEGAWSDDVSIDFSWTDRGNDGVSGVRGYSLSLTQVSDERPDEVMDMDGRGSGPFSTVQYATGDGHWYFHLMTRDMAGNWSNPVHLGPYRIDTGPPTVPVMVLSSHTVGGWSTDSTIYVTWTSSDGGGSGIAGSSYLWDELPTHFVDTSLDTTSNFTTSASLPDGAWYLHLRALDLGGNASDIARLGPFGVDTAGPHSCWIDAPSTTTNVSFDVHWSYQDSTSGVASYDVQVRDDPGGTWTDWQMGTSGTSGTFTGAQYLHTYAFRVRARDEAGNISVYACQDETTVLEDLEATALEVTQVIQNLANEVPLVEDKRTYVRFYARSGWSDVPGVDAELHGSRDGLPLPGSPLSPDRLTTAHAGGGDRANLHDAFTFALPPEWRSGTVELRGVVNPDHSMAEVSHADNERLEIVTFEPGCDLCLMMVPVHLHLDTYRVGDAGYDGILRLLGVYYPVPEGGIEDHAGRTMTPAGHETGWEYDLPDDYGWVLSDLWCYAFWTWDRPCSDMHFYGMVHPNSQPTGSAGMGYRPGHQAAGVMAIARGADWPQPVGGRIMAHELGHNLGRRHVLCTGCEPDGGDVDAGYPYLEAVPPICDNPYTCRIGPVGLLRLLA